MSRKTEIPRTLETGQRRQPPYLNGFVESDTEVSEYLEAFIQSHRFSVFAKKVYEGVSLILQLPFPEFQLRQLFHGKLQKNKQGHTR